MLNKCWKSVVVVGVATFADGKRMGETAILHKLMGGVTYIHLGGYL